MITAKSSQAAAALDDTRADHITGSHVDDIDFDLDPVWDHRPLSSSILPVQDRRKNQDVLVATLGLSDRILEIFRDASDTNHARFGAGGVVQDLRSIAS